MAGGLGEVNDVLVGEWEEAGECDGVLPVVWLLAKVVVSDGLAGENTRLPVPGCVDGVTGGGVDWCGAVNPVALVGRTNGEELWWQGLDGMFAVCVRLVVWEMAVCAYEWGTGSRDMASATGAFACARCDVAATWANAMGGLDRGRNSGSRAPGYECGPAGGGEYVVGAGGGVKATGRSNRDGAWLLGLGPTSVMVSEEGKAFARLSREEGSIAVLELVIGVW